MNHNKIIGSYNWVVATTFGKITLAVVLKTNLRESRVDLGVLWVFVIQWMNV